MTIADLHARFLAAGNDKSRHARQCKRCGHGPCQAAIRINNRAVQTFNQYKRAYGGQAP